MGADLVYLVDQDNSFYSFDPPTTTFTKIATLNCPDFIGQPFSMGVDRNAIAWVLYDDGELFHVDINNGAACTATSFNMPMGMGNFGMGFSTDAVGGSTDTLFIAGGPVGADPSSGNPATFDTLNTSTMSAASVGSVNGWPELTGNSNAELWGWFPDANAPKVEKLDKTTGTASLTYQSTLTQLKGTPMAWAFAFYGGDYWVFLQKDTDNNTIVYQISGTDGSVKGSKTTNKTIVGAGVSTCAPVVIM